MVKKMICAVFMLCIALNFSGCAFPLNDAYIFRLQMKLN